MEGRSLFAHSLRYWYAKPSARHLQCEGYHVFETLMTNTYLRQPPLIYDENLRKYRAEL